MAARIRDAQLDKVPYMLVVGDREEQAGAVAVRTRAGEDLGRVPLDAYIARAAASQPTPQNQLPAEISALDSLLRGRGRTRRRGTRVEAVTDCLDRVGKDTI